MSPFTRRVLMGAGSVTHGAPISVPIPAAAVGYTVLTFNDDFDSIATIDFNGTASSGHGCNWTVRLPFTNDPPVVTTTNTTIANSILTLRQTTDNLNQGIFTTNRVMQSHLAGPFQYGYFEAKLKFDASLVSSSPGSTGWPSFWSIGATHALFTNTTRWPELDFFEFARDTSKPSGGVFAGSIHDHDNTTGTEVDHWNVGYNTMNVNPATWNDWHLYGCLWQPGSIKWYFDNTLINTQTYTASGQTPPASNGNPAGAYSLLDNPTHGPATIVLGTGAACPLYVDWVRVWN